MSICFSKCASFEVFLWVFVSPFSSVVQLCFCIFVFVCACVLCVCRITCCSFSTWAAEWKSHPCTSLPRGLFRVLTPDTHHNVITHSPSIYRSGKAVGNPRNKPQHVVEKDTVQEWRREKMEGRLTSEEEPQGAREKCREMWIMTHWQELGAISHCCRVRICACSYLKSSGDRRWVGRASGIC